MKIGVTILEIISLLFGTLSYADNPLQSSKQLLLVISQNWSATTGVLQRYERTTQDTKWRKVGTPCNVNLGRNGMGWGKGLHGNDPLTDGPVVFEGSGRSPAGAYNIPAAFGNYTASDWNIKIPYDQIFNTTFCPDDIKSQHYNSIVDTRSTLKDWDSAEDMQQMANEGLYIYGSMVGHNMNPVTPGSGSCIFIHIWHGPNRPTAGCTSMEINNAKEVISWLDQLKNPALVQLPISIYYEFADAWELPII